MNWEILLRERRGKARERNEFYMRGSENLGE